MEKDVSFYSEGFKLAGTLFIPDDLAKGEKRSGIIGCTGYGANSRKASISRAFYRYFCKKGYIVLQFEYRGFGESEGPRWSQIPMEEVEDARNAITFLQQQPQVDGSNIGFWGTSWGGGIAIYVAALDERVRCLATNVAVGNGRKWLRSLRNNWEWQALLEELEEDRVRRVLTGTSKMVDWLHIMVCDPVTKAHIEKTMKENPENYVTELSLESAQATIEFTPDEVVHKIAPRPILFTVAERDCLVPVEVTKELYDNAGEPKKLVVVPGINHYKIYFPPYSQVVMDETFAWFNQYMPPVSHPKAST